MRKAELIAFLQDNTPQEPQRRPSKPTRPPPPPPGTSLPQVQETPRSGVRFRPNRPRQPELLRRLENIPTPQRTPEPQEVPLTKDNLSVEGIRILS